MKALLILLALARVAAAEPTSTSPLEDSAMVIGEGDEAVIENDLRQLSTAGVDLAVIVTRRLGGVAIESYAHDAAVQWTSGKAESASSAVLVIAIDDRKSRIEVNDTFRPKFADSRAQVILDNIRGYLRAGDYAGAVRAVITDVGKASRGEPPDLESPNPQASLPVTTQPSSPPSASSSYRGKSDHTVLYLVIGGIAFILGMGALWAAAARKSNFTLSHDGSVKTLQRPFIVDWLWHSAKLVGWFGFIIFIIATASGNSSSNTSSSWGSSTGSSSSGGGFSGSSGGSGGGWSGGGASSSW